MTKLCFSLLLLTALGGLTTLEHGIDMFPMFRPSSDAALLGTLALLYIPPIVIALQAAAPPQRSGPFPDGLWLHCLLVPLLD